MEGYQAASFAEGSNFASTKNKKTTTKVPRESAEAHKTDTKETITTKTTQTVATQGRQDTGPISQEAREHKTNGHRSFETPSPTHLRIRDLLKELGGAARGRPGVGVRTESTTEPSELKEDGAGEAGGTAVAEEAEKDWEGEGEWVEDGPLGATETLYRGF